MRWIPLKLYGIPEKLVMTDQLRGIQKLAPFRKCRVFVICQVSTRTSMCPVYSNIVTKQQWKYNCLFFFFNASATIHPWCLFNTITHYAILRLHSRLRLDWIKIKNNTISVKWMITRWFEHLLSWSFFLYDFALLIKIAKLNRVSDNVHYPY